MSTRQKAVYVRYWDHVYFRNIQTPGAVAVMRETVGWVKKENDEVMLIECDRPLRKGCGGLNGLVILKNCIITTFELPLQADFEHNLNCQNHIVRNRVPTALLAKEAKNSKNRRDEKY